VQELDIVAALETNGATKVLALAALYLLGINITFRLTASNGAFSGAAPSCVRTDQLSSFVSEVEALPIAPALARLDDNDSDGYIELWRVDELGHVGVRAQVGLSSEDHSVVSFQTDQTAVPAFARVIRGLSLIALP
jgi:hypothetical protein